MVLRRFLVVAYRETPGERLLTLLRHSVHSKVITIRTPFLLAIILLRVIYIFTDGQPIIPQLSPLSDAMLPGLNAQY